MSESPPEPKPEKTCFKCKVRQPISEFYRHAKMRDGHLNKCKTCTKTDVQERYQLVGGRPKYEQQREKKPKRKADKSASVRKYRLRHPLEYKARNAVSNAVRDGRLIRQPCEVCGTTERVQAHHHDYTKPLDVNWLCFQHHREDEHGQTIRTEELKSEPKT